MTQEKKLDLIDFDSNCFSDSESTKKSLATIWGLYDLRRYLVAEDTDMVTARKVEQLIGEYVRAYSEVLASPTEAVRKLVGSGYVDDRTKVLSFIDPSIQECPDIEIDLPGVFFVGAVGLIQSGKSSIGQVVSEYFDGKHYQFVDSLKAFSYTIGYGVSESRARKREVNDIFKGRFGNAVFAECTIRRGKRQARMDNTNVVSFDGFRSVEEAQLIRDRGRFGILLGVAASLEKRYQRATKTKKIGEKPLSFKEFKHDSDYEKQYMMGPALELVEMMFDNEPDGTEHLRKQVVEYLESKIFGS